MPFACVDYLGLEYGVKGPGERILVELADRLAARADPSAVPGLLVNRGNGRVTRSSTPDPDTALGGVGEVECGQSRAWQVDTDSSYTRRSGDRWKVDNLGYYERGGLGNILTKSGCPYACAHCVEPDAKGTAFAKRSVHAVVDELTELVDQGVRDVHTADSEFNLAIANTKAVLREISRRKNSSPASPLHQLRLWIYAQPKPFDDEFAELLAAAGCAGVNVAPDHVRDDMLDGWKVTAKGTRYYTWSDTENLVKLCNKYDMACMVEVLAGMPGETWPTLREAIDRTLALDATVSGFSLGLRCFPYQPLGQWLAEQSAACTARTRNPVGHRHRTHRAAHRRPVPLPRGIRTAVHVPARRHRPPGVLLLHRAPRRPRHHGRPRRTLAPHRPADVGPHRPRRLPPRHAAHRTRQLQGRQQLRRQPLPHRAHRPGIPRRVLGEMARARRHPHRSEKARHRLTPWSPQSYAHPHRYSAFQARPPQYA